MTIADRHVPGRTRDGFSEELAELLATADDARRLVTLSRPADPVDPIALFVAARARDLEAVLWLQPSSGRSIVGIGRAWAFEGGGRERFGAATAAWGAVLGDAVAGGASVGLPGGGPVLLGGLGFTGLTPARDDPWAPFGPASLVLPTFTVTQEPGAANLAVAIAPGRARDPDPDEVEDAWTSLLTTARVTAGTGTTDPDGPLTMLESRPDRAGWDRIVGMFAGAVGRGRIDKVVLARRAIFESLAEHDIGAALRHLAATAPESTTFAFSRDGTTFLGATPERLARTVGRSFETVAIAGSAPRGEDRETDARYAAALLASEKDREEHAVVVDTLRAGLAPIVETLTIADAPGILPLRHVQHLVTPMTGTLREDAGLLGLAAVLHPTPAVGGEPRDVALDLIAEHEGFDRGWYAGPIGWLGADGDGELMVALRCGLVRDRDAVLFAGCGIVADSEPGREWDESRLKLRTMIAALGGEAEEDA
ncbi:MAG: isochorismate synthase MenF [Chloroflexota bacterium]